MHVREKPAAVYMKVVLTRVEAAQTLVVDQLHSLVNMDEDLPIAPEGHPAPLIIVLP